MSAATQAPAQCMRALDHANAIRSARLKIVGQVGRCELQAAAVVLSPPACVATMTLSDLLCAQPGWGSARTRRFLVEVGISDRVTLEAVTVRQRVDVARRLPPARPWACRSVHPPEQRYAGLLKANGTRTARAELKADIRAGRVAVADVVADPPDFAVTMRLSALLLAVPMLGPVRVAAMLRGCGTAADVTLGALSPVARVAVVARCRAARPTTSQEEGPA